MSPSELQTPLALLGQLSPAAFMQQYWQRQPLLIRQAMPNWRCPVTPTALRRHARNDDTECRLIWREDEQWHMDRGPFSRLPAAARPDWTLLVQGMDLLDDDMALLRDRFRFIPDARLDDVMISLASQGGGVGPHFDSYDVFLLQARGQRRWRISQQSDLSLVPDLPLKVLANFKPEEEYVLEPGDMLYLPPHVAHDGIAESTDCMTISIGFRSPSRAELAAWVYELAAERCHSAAPRGAWARRYTDPGQAATANPAALPDRLCDAALKAARSVSLTPELVADALGRWLSEPKDQVFFDAPEYTIDVLDDWPAGARLSLDRRTRLLYRGKRGYINGEILGPVMSGLLLQLADQRSITCPRQAPALRIRELLQEWVEAGWIHCQDASADENP